VVGLDIADGTPGYAPARRSTDENAYHWEGGWASQ
jgi:hypothetical protein